MRQEAISAPGGALEVQEHHYRMVETVPEIARMIEGSISQLSPSTALVTISLRFQDTIPAATRERSCHYYLSHLRLRVRKTDIVLMRQQQFHFLLLGANRQGGQLVQERLWDTLLWRIHHTAEQDISQPLHVSIGHSAYPLPDPSGRECLVTAGMQQQSALIHQSDNGPAAHEPEELSRLARKLGIPYLSLLPRQFPRRLKGVISPKLAQELHCFPLGRERNTLTVAMSDPQNSQALDRLKKETGMQIYPVLASPQELQAALEKMS